MLLATFVVGDPAAPLSITRGASYSANFTATENSVAAQAGNTTELTLSGVSVTQTWQGYYGNVSGYVTLDDADNNSLYRWQTFSSSGEVYASNNSGVNWDTVQCINFTANGSQVNNVTTLESQFNIDDADPDGFNETFNYTYSGTFYIGTRKFNTTHQCPMTYLQNGTGMQTEHFKEILMTDNSTRGIIFVSFTEDNEVGFSDTVVDFEMIVADDGHDGDTEITNYYFYVEMV